jgi:hypothetical protein
MNNLYLLRGANVLKVGNPLLIKGSKPSKAFKAKPGIETPECMSKVESIAVRVPPFGSAHDAAIELVASGKPGLWCLSKDACDTPPTARKGRFVLPSPWSFLAVSARVREIPERKVGLGTQITVHLEELVGQ